MHYKESIISYFQNNNILAIKLDHAINGVAKAVSSQIETIEAGAKRALYYTSCFTDEYQDVCQQQKSEDLRFVSGVYQILQNVDVIYEMLQIYFEEVFKYKTSAQLEHIKKLLMAVNVHIAASSLTNHGFALAVATSVATGLNLSLEMSALTGKKGGTIATFVGVYGIVQKAADSAHRINYTYPSYYAALYTHKLEMMFFLIEPLFERAGALIDPSASEASIAEKITRMIR